MTAARPLTDASFDEWLLARLFEAKPEARGARKDQLSPKQFWIWDAKAEEWRQEKSRATQFSTSLDDCAFLEQELRRGLWTRYAEVLIEATDDGEYGFVSATARARAETAVKVLMED